MPLMATWSQRSGCLPAFIRLLSRTAEPRAFCAGACPTSHGHDLAIKKSIVLSLWSLVPRDEKASVQGTLVASAKAEQFTLRYRNVTFVPAPIRRSLGQSLTASGTPAAADNAPANTRFTRKILKRESKWLRIISELS